MRQIEELLQSAVDKAKMNGIDKKELNDILDMLFDEM